MKPGTIALLAGIGFTGLALDLLAETKPKPPRGPMPPPVPGSTKEALRAAKMKGREGR
jgi:hypothetical protein